MPEPRSVSVARAAVRGFLESAGVSDPESAVLLVSELVSNAVVHPAVAKGPIEVIVDVDRGCVHIEVVDADPRPPVTRAHGVDDEFGRGLMIVDRLADAWGWAPLADNGKKVWCDVRPAVTSGT
jgi:anti-sigma regulatory factor (Ser/Thr protein kinase)